MYEKHGLMSKLTDKKVLAYLRERPETNLYLVETALRKKLGMKVEAYHPQKFGRKKNRGCVNALPVKLLSQDLIRYVLEQKNEHGISHRFTIETALKKYMMEA